MVDLERFIRGLPKAELHLHIEGTLEPELCLALAARNGVVLRFRTVDELRAAYRFRNLQDFLDLYYQGTSVLRHAADFYDLTRAYLDRAVRENIRHAEIFFDPQAHMRRDVPLRAVVDGIDQALKEAEAGGRITTRLILCFLRDLSAEDAMATLQEALPYKDRIVGVGLDSAEAGHPPGKFRDVFARARREGLLAVAHAGEEGPPAYVREALDELQVSRIDHGVRSIEDDALVKRLADARTPLTVCPLSNLRLQVVDNLARHPLRRLLERHVVATVNSDDPAYFGGYINQNYRAAATALGLGVKELCTLARNSFAASFLDAAAKAKHIAEVDAYEASIQS